MFLDTRNRLHLHVSVRVQMQIMVDLKLIERFLKTNNDILSDFIFLKYMSI